MFNRNDHSFVICAYKVNPHLEMTIQSLLNQTVKSKVFVSTSTPNDHIKGLCEKYGLDLFVNPSPKNEGKDWNWAYDHAPTPLVTIAHQDDVYEPDFLEKTLKYIGNKHDFIIAFTDYYEIRNDKKVYTNKILKVKRIILRKLARVGNSSIVRDKRRALRFGSAICCPSVTYVMPNLETPLFSSEMKCDLDWEAWERFSRLEGSFVYSPEILMHHRIHKESETTSLIQDNTRSSEDLAMLEKFWPKKVAKVIHRLYSVSMNSNTL